MSNRHLAPYSDQRTVQFTRRIEKRHRLLHVVKQRQLSFVSLSDFIVVTCGLAATFCQISPIFTFLLIFPILSPKKYVSVISLRAGTQMLVYAGCGLRRLKTRHSQQRRPFVVESMFFSIFAESKLQKN